MADTYEAQAVEERKILMARRIWPFRGMNRPSIKGDRHETYAQRFERLFGEPLASFAARAKREGLRAKIRARHIAANGSSPLDVEPVHCFCARCACRRIDGGPSGGFDADGYPEIVCASCLRGIMDGHKRHESLAKKVERGRDAALEYSIRHG